MSDSPSVTTFGDEVREALSRNPRLSGNETAIIATVEYFGDSNWAGVAAYGGEGGTGFTDFGWTEDEAAVVARVAASESAEAEENGGDVQVQVTAAAVVEETEVEQPVGGAYAHLLNGVSASGISASALSARIKPDFVRRGAQATFAAVFTGSGVLPVFLGEEIWQKYRIDNMELRQTIHQWRENVRLGKYGSDATIQALFDGVAELFGPRFDELITGVAQMSAQIETMKMIGSGARVDVGDSAAVFSTLSQRIPLLAEEVSEAMIASSMPETAAGAIQMVTDLFVILKNPLFQQYAGVVNPATPEQGAVLLLENATGNRAYGNQLRLALAYEQLIDALAACPADPDSDYLTVMGILANDLRTLFEHIAPAGEVQAQETPFRVPAEAPSIVRQRRISFSLSLKFTIR